MIEEQKLKLIIDGKSEIVYFAILHTMGEKLYYKGKNYWTSSLTYDNMDDCKVVELKSAD